VRRKRGECKASHVTLAVVRDLKATLPDMLPFVCGSAVPGLYARQARVAAKDFLARIINQNEQALGLFYLHPDSSVGIAVPSVSMLRVAITLRISHYEELLAARRGALSAEFCSKLGWLVGNLYARVGTQDWSETGERKAAADALVDDLLDYQDSPAGPFWLEQEIIGAARDQGVDFASLPRAQWAEAVAKIVRPPKPADLAVRAVADVCRRLNLPEDTVNTIEKRLRNHQGFVMAVKKGHADIPVLGD